MYPLALVPDDLTLPRLVTQRFTLERLEPKHLERDFEAIAATGDALDGTIAPPGAIGDVTSFTIEEDLTELHWHLREFRRRSSFAFIAIETGTRRSLGCAYINPTDRSGFDAEVTAWGRLLANEPNWDAVFFELIREWVVTQWPFDRPAFPGRAIPWNEWSNMARKLRL
jgi:hypothetical protein